MAPEHVAIIMDGNGRWAQARGHSRAFGHIRGAQVVKKIVKAAGNLGIKYLSLYTFSTENWKRPEAEIKLLMKLLRRYLDKETQSLIQENVKLTYIGDISAFPQLVQDRILNSVEATKNNTGIVLNLALNYGSRQEIVAAARRLAILSKNGEIEIDKIDSEAFAAALDSSWLPDPDLVIRTSGESRLSNFFLWQLSYSELYFVESNWPDFSSEDLKKACDWYSNRDRRFGGIDNAQQPKKGVISIPSKGSQLQ